LADVERATHGVVGGVFASDSDRQNYSYGGRAIGVRAT